MRYREEFIRSKDKLLEFIQAIKSELQRDQTREKMLLLRDIFDKCRVDYENISKAGHSLLMEAEIPLITMEREWKELQSTFEKMTTDKHGDVNMAFQHSDGGGGGDSAPCGLFFVVYLKIEIIFKQLRHP